MSDNVANIRQASVDEFIELRRSVSWGTPDRDAIAEGLKNSLFSVCIERYGELVGYGRVVGDNGFTIFVQDVIVKPPYQRQGIGTLIMTSIMEYIMSKYRIGTYIGLMATTGKEEFYKRFGFIARPNEQMGAGMIQFIK